MTKITLTVCLDHDRKWSPKFLIPILYTRNPLVNICVVEMLTEHYLSFDTLSKCLRMTKEEMRWYANDVARIRACSCLLAHLENLNVLKSQFIKKKETKFQLKFNTCEEQLHIFIECGFDFLIGFTTSEKSMAVDIKLGLKCIKKIDMKNYRDSCTGETVFDVAEAELKDNWTYVMCMDLRWLRQNSKI
ncbi:uncharacterized protein LOC144747718 [Ciona intestinalis]